MRVRESTAITALLWLFVASPLNATEELPDDEFLEFLGVWDAAWSEACDPAEVFSEEDACLEYDDDDEQDSVDDED